MAPYFWLFAAGLMLAANVYLGVILASTGDTTAAALNFAAAAFILPFVIYLAVKMAKTP